MRPDSKYTKHEDILKLVQADTEAGFKKVASLWFAVMILSLYYRPIVESHRKVTAAKEEPRKEGKTGKPGKKGKQKRTKIIYTKQYTLTGAVLDEIPPVQHRRAKPSHEFSVKGHFRHYKSGKVAWISPQIRCKGRGEAKRVNEYIARLQDSESEKLEKKQ